MGLWTTNVVAYTQFATDAQKGNLPAVSWLSPTRVLAEQSPSSAKEFQCHCSAVRRESFHQQHGASNRSGQRLSVSFSYIGPGRANRRKDAIRKLENLRLAYVASNEQIRKHPGNAIQ
jgi:hypothetical protein